MLECIVSGRAVHSWEHLRKEETCLFYEREETAYLKLDRGHQTLFSFLRRPCGYTPAHVSQDHHVGNSCESRDIRIDCLSSERPTAIHMHAATGVTTSKERERSPAARIWIRRRNHCSLFMEPQMSEGQRASQDRHARGNTGTTQVLLANMSLQFESVLISTFDNIWCFSFTTLIQILAVKTLTKKTSGERKKQFT